MIRSDGNRSGQRWALAFFLAGAILMLGAGPVSARTVVRPPVKGAAPSNAYKNFKAAIDFLRACGDTKEADHLERLLKNGKLGFDPKQKENGDTDTSSNITVSGGLAGASRSRGVKAFDPVKNFFEIIGLARTLFHERIHIGHGGGYRIWSNLPGASLHEIDAWTKTIKAMVRWVQQALTAYENSAGSLTERLAELKRISLLVSATRSYVGSFEENEGTTHGPYYGDKDNPANWKKLYKKLGDLSRMLSLDQNELINAREREKCELACRNLGNEARVALANLTVAQVELDQLQSELKILRRKFKDLNQQVKDREVQAAQARKDLANAKTQKGRLAAAGRIPNESTTKRMKKERDALRRKIRKLRRKENEARKKAADAKIKSDAAVAAYNNCRIAWYQKAIDDEAISEDALPGNLEVKNGKVIIAKPRRKTEFGLPGRFRYEDCKKALGAIIGGLTGPYASLIPGERTSQSVGDDEERLAAIRRMMGGLSETSGTSVRVPFGRQEEDLSAIARGEVKKRYSVLPSRRGGEVSQAGDAQQTEQSGGTETAQAGTSGAAQSGETETAQAGNTGVLTTETASAQTSGGEKSASSLGSFAGALGQWQGDGGCGLEVMSLAQSGNQLVMKGAGPDVSLSVSGDEASGQGAVLFGIANHKVRLRIQLKQIQMTGSNDSGGSCVSVFTQIRF